MKVVPLTVRMLLQFMQEVREIDKEEVVAATGVSFEDFLIKDLADTQALVDEDGNVFAIGAIEDNSVWLITTTRIETQRIKFLRFTRQLLKEALEEHGTLGNMVYLKNQVHVDWLTWLGCEYHPEVKMPEGFMLFLFRPKEVK